MNKIIIVIFVIALALVLFPQQELVEETFEESVVDNLIVVGVKVHILIDSPRLYNIVNGPHEAKILKLSANGTDFTFNAFTFG